MCVQGAGSGMRDMRVGANQPLRANRPPRVSLVSRGRPFLRTALCGNRKWHSLKKKIQSPTLFWPDLRPCEGPKVQTRRAWRRSINWPLSSGRHLNTHVIWGEGRGDQKANSASEGEHHPPTPPRPTARAKLGFQSRLTLDRQRWGWTLTQSYPLDAGFPDEDCVKKRVGVGSAKVA